VVLAALNRSITLECCILRLFAAHADPPETITKNRAARCGGAATRLADLTIKLRCGPL
jgi:hypothetical protein